MTLKDLQTRIDQLVVQANATLRNASGGYLRSGDWAALRAASLAFIESNFGQTHSYYREFDARVNDVWESCGKYAVGILTAIQEQIRGGWIETTKGLVTAEVFADFLEMAEHLLSESYKDPAAVMIGSTLEEHLRQLCLAASIPIQDVSSGKAIPRKADSLNADLAKAGKYSKLDQKQITASLDLRNKAAHGKYSEYTAEQVGLMLASVREFMTRVRP